MGGWPSYLSNDHLIVITWLASADVDLTARSGCWAKAVEQKLDADACRCASEASNVTPIGFDEAHEDREAGPIEQTQQ